MQKKYKPFLSIFYQRQTRVFLFQAIALVAVIAVVYNIANNAADNIAARNINVGFDFLDKESSFAISETLIPYSEESTNWKVFFVGILNTLYVSSVGIFFASLIGLFIGIARLSSNWLVQKLSSAYIELFRNIPILLQILFWYNIIINTLPSVHNSFDFFGFIFVNQRGVYMPKVIPDSGFIFLVILFIITIATAFVIKRYARKQKEKTGKTFKTGYYAPILIVSLPTLGYFVLGQPSHLEIPQLSGFNFSGGFSISPEFMALTFALSVYTATYIAEAIRSGIEAVNKGQKEAAKSLGLTRGQSLKLVILPQALRIAVPPIINQYLNLAKNSSLAVAIGYPDLVSVFTGTVLSKIGQAIEIVFMTMLVYLIISLLISFALNTVNEKLKIKER